MSAPIPVALLGFSTFERNALASFFRLAPRRLPAYEHVLDIDHARFVVADADQPGVPELLDALGRTHDSVFIGAHSAQDAAVWMMRPIDPAQVLRELDNLLAVRDNPATGPLPMRARTSHFAPLPDPPVPVAAPPALRRSGDDGPSPLRPVERPVERQAERLADSAARRQRRAAALRPVVVRRVLIVDDSDVALAFLERHLHRHDLAVDSASTSSQAIALLTQRSYGMVFLDIDLGEQSEMDGLALCQHIKRRHVHPGGQAPMVVLVSAFSEAVDRVRGSLAGADGHLGKPLDVAALDRMLQTHGLGSADSRSGAPSR